MISILETTTTNAHHKAPRLDAKNRSPFALSLWLQLEVILQHFLLLMTTFALNYLLGAFIHFVHIDKEPFLIVILGWTDSALVFLFCLEAVTLMTMAVASEIGRRYHIGAEYADGIAAQRDKTDGN